MAHTHTIADSKWVSEQRRERYAAEGHWEGRTFPEIAAETLAAYPDSRAVAPDRELSFGELADEVRELAGGLHEAGIRQGDVVSYQLPNWTKTQVVHLALLQLGAVINPIPPNYRRQEVGYILDDADAKCVIVPEGYREFDYVEMVDEIEHETGRVITVGDPSRGDSSRGDFSYAELRAAGSDAPRPDISPNDVHVLAYTSGTTADPKGVLHTHETLLNHHRRIINGVGISEETTMFIASPVTHILGLGYALQVPFISGMDIVLMDRWNPKRAIDVIEDNDCNVMVGTTPFLQGIVDEAPDDWENQLRVFSCGESDVPPELVREASNALNCTVRRSYGSTEYPTAVTSPLDAPIEKRAETDGRPDRSVETKIVDLESGEPVSRDEKGELLLQGPSLTVGYTDPTATE